MIAQKSNHLQYFHFVGHVYNVPFFWPVCIMYVMSCIKFGLDWSSTDVALPTLYVTAILIED